MRYMIRSAYYNIIYIYIHIYIYIRIRTRVSNSNLKLHELLQRYPETWIYFYCFPTAAFLEGHSVPHESGVCGDGMHSIFGINIMEFQSLTGTKILTRYAAAADATDGHPACGTPVTTIANAKSTITNISPLSAGVR